ncbi:MAG: Gfo/Idh/MocA family oxidoreductase [Fimbriimonadales bacterium]|nr:Gfo/Idh/MocA family oxidoreductase [Fimbriimonadales bacterium]
MGYRWGILGTGKIARRFMQAASLVPEAQVVAVGSRSQQTADAFGEQFSIPHRYGSYEALLTDPEVEIVYVATPHTLHAENTHAALEQGKHVLCEKPFTLNARQAEPLVALARQKRLFLMEGMWTRCFPLMREVVARLQAGEIGAIRLIQADFGFRAPYDPSGRLLNPALGGGALLDVGVYPVALAFLFLGEPMRVHSAAAIGQTGVDEQCALLFEYADGALAILSAAIQTDTPKEATLCGTKGRLRLHTPWWKPSEATLTRADGSEELIQHAYTGDGLQFEIRHVHDCLRQGLTESPWMPLDETLRMLRLLDRIRAQWGLIYPGEGSG